MAVHASAGTPVRSFAEVDAVSVRVQDGEARCAPWLLLQATVHRNRSEEHTSELHSLAYLVCRLLLEKKKKCQRCLTPLLGHSCFLIAMLSPSLSPSLIAPCTAFTSVSCLSYAHAVSVKRRCMRAVRE